MAKPDTIVTLQWHILLPLKMMTQWQAILHHEQVCRCVETTTHTKKNRKISQKLSWKFG